MSVDIGESLMQTWLRHVKGCDIVQTNWKAAMHTMFDKNRADEFLNSIRKVSDFDFFAQGKSAESIIRQAEIDALGCVVADKHYIAGEVAFHEDGLHYKSSDSVPSKILRTLLTLYGYLNAKEATVIFATPYIKTDNERKNLEDFVLKVNEFLNEQEKEKGFKKYRVKLFSDKDFEVGILNPVLYLVSDIKDNSEVFVRACKLINIAKVSKTNPSGGEVDYIETTCGKIDVSEMKAQALIESFVIPKLSTMSNRDLEPYFDEKSKIIKVSYPFLSHTREEIAGKHRYYKREYYLSKTKQNVYVTSECKTAALIDWINNN